MEARGEIGRVAPIHYGFMGHIIGSRIRPLIEESAPAIARALKNDGVDAVILTPG